MAYSWFLQEDIPYTLLVSYHPDKTYSLPRLISVLLHAQAATVRISDPDTLHLSIRIIFISRTFTLPFLNIKSFILILYPLRFTCTDVLKVVRRLISPWNSHKYTIFRSIRTFTCPTRAASHLGTDFTCKTCALKNIIHMQAGCGITRKSIWRWEDIRYIDAAEDMRNAVQDNKR